MLYHPLHHNKDISIVSLSYVKQRLLDGYIETSTKEKCDFESAYAFSMFFVVFTSALWFSLPDDTESHDIIEKLLIVWRDTKGNECREILRQAFEYGYKANDCEKIIKNVFENMLFEDLHYYKPLATEIKKNFERKNIIEILDSTDLKKASVRLSKDISKLQSTSDFIRKLTVNYKKREGTIQYESFMKNMKQVFENTFKRSIGVIHDSMYKYFIDISEQILERGGLYNKNNILDGLILQHLYRNDCDKILTFDGGMLKHLDKYKSEVKKYQNSLDIYNECKI